MSAVLSTQAVSYLRRGRRVVDTVSIEIASGEMVIIVGPNGAGKSTLLRLLSGELRPSSGVVACEGRELAFTPSWLLACKRAVMTQSSQVSFDFTAHEVVQLGVEGLGSVARNQRAALVDQCLAQADALQFASRRYEALSGGEQRRVQFARALAQLEAGRSIGQRQALLLDEPVANLDLNHQLGLLDAAKAAAARGVAVLAILHDLNLAARYGDALALMSDGALVGVGRPNEILTSAVLSKVFGIELTATQELISDDVVVVPSHWRKSPLRSPLALGRP